MSESIKMILCLSRPCRYLAGEAVRFRLCLKLGGFGGYTAFMTCPQSPFSVHCVNPTWMSHTFAVYVLLFFVSSLSVSQGSNFRQADVPLDIGSWFSDCSEVQPGVMFVSSGYVQISSNWFCFRFLCTALIPSYLVMLRFFCLLVIPPPSFHD